MKIDTNGINSLPTDGAKRSDNAKALNSEHKAATSPDAPKASDNVSFSPSAQNLAKIEAELKSLPEINQSRVDEVKARIDRGEYQPDSSNLAQKMLNLE